MASLIMAFSPGLIAAGLWSALGGLAVFLALSGKWFWVAVIAAVVTCSLRGELALQQRLPETCNGRIVTVQGSVASLPRISLLADGRERQRFEFDIDSAAPEVCASPRTVLLSYYGERRFLPDQHWQLEVRLRRPWGLANPASFNMQSWYALSGIDAIGTVRQAGRMLLLEHPPSPLRWHDRQRAVIRAAIHDAKLSSTAEAVLSAVTIADKSGIGHDLWRQLQHYGINHLLVISGLHVALVSALAFWLGRLLGAGLGAISSRASRFPWAEVSAFSLALAYTGLAGFSVATQRALVMLACYLLSRVLLRTSSGFNNLLVAAFVLSVINPLVFLGAGFWLSFGAVAVLLWSGRWQGRGGLAKVLRPQLAIALAMLPLGAFWFGGSSWVSPLANLLMIPLLGCFVTPLSLVGAFLVLIGADGAAAACWQLAALPLDVLWPLIVLIDRHAPLYWQTSAGIGSMLLVLAGCLLCMVPLSCRVRVTSLLLALAILLPKPPPQVPPQLDVLDVGQGTAVVFRAGGRTLLYDTGGGRPNGANLARQVVLPWLRNRGVRRLDDLVISHNDLDHSAGLTAVLEAMAVNRLWQGEPSVAAGRSCLVGVAWEWPDGSRFRFLSPTGAEQGNDASCVLQIDAGGRRFLLPGDIGQAQERELVRYWREALRSDVLLVAHHGSNTSTYQAWLNQVAPDVAIIATGYASRFGHPHEQVLARLRRSAADIRQTASEGAINVRVEPAGVLLLTAYRAGYQAWWM